MGDEGHMWQQQDAAKMFLEDVRGGIPLADEQIDVLMRIVRHALPTVERFLDLGCGDGILGRTVQGEYPKAAGVFLDFSQYMIEAARQKADPQRAVFVVQSFAADDWVQAVERHGPFDLVLSGLAIHHLEDERKASLYREIFDLLSPGGLFLNLDQVLGVSAWARQAYDDRFVDSLWAHHRAQGGTQPREAIVTFWRNRLGKAVDIPAPLNVQCRWLEEIGFVDVDCFLKIFELALFGGRKPATAAG